MKTVDEVRPVRRESLSRHLPPGPQEAATDAVRYAAASALVARRASLLRCANRRQTGREKSKDMIVEITGSFGKYQLWLYFLLILTKGPIAWNQLGIIFYAPPVEYKCGTVRQGASLCPCSNPEFDKSIFTNTIIMEWNLICDRKSKVALVQSTFQAGTLVGSMGLGMAADRFGRRPTMIVACVFQFGLGMAMVYVYDFFLFVVCRLLMGITVGGTVIIGFVILVEFIGPEYRAIFSALFQVPFNLGVASLPLLAYFNRDWRDFQLVISVPVFVLFIYIFTLPETPRWLLIKGRNEEAIKILTYTAKINGRPTHNIRQTVEAYQLLASRNKDVKGSTVDLFKTPNLRRNTIAMSWNWLSCSYCYYGVSQYVGQIGGDIFTNVAASAILVTCGSLLSIPLMRMMGRKTLLLLCYATCSTCLMLLAFSDGMMAVACAGFGVVSAFIVFIVVYLHASELFPTVVRNAAIGFSSMSARIGSIAAPFVIDLRDKATWLPPLVFAVAPSISFFVTMLLPETKGCDLLTTIEEAENFKSTTKK